MITSLGVKVRLSCIPEWMCNNHPIPAQKLSHLCARLSLLAKLHKDEQTTGEETSQLRKRPGKNGGDFSHFHMYGRQHHWDSSWLVNPIEEELPSYHDFTTMYYKIDHHLFMLQSQQNAIMFPFSFWKSNHFFIFAGIFSRNCCHVTRVTLRAGNTFYK